MPPSQACHACSLAAPAAGQRRGPKAQPVKTEDTDMQPSQPVYDAEQPMAAPEAQASAEPSGSTDDTAVPLVDRLAGALLPLRVVPCAMSLLIAQKPLSYKQQM